MERHDSIKRAARYLLGAGIFAVTVLAMTTGRVSAEVVDCTVCGQVFTDKGEADHVYQPGEELDDITVVVTDTHGAEITSIQLDCTGSLDPCGYYSFNFTGFDNGTYFICVVIGNQSRDCSARSDAETFVYDGTGGHVVDLEVVPPSAPPTGPGTGTPGYWKNHSNMWPPQGVSVGGVTYQGDTIALAIKLMGKVGGDKTITIFSSLISAKLNGLVGNDASCVATEIENADNWLTEHPVGSNVKASSAAWTLAEPWHTRLDDYNNGKLCAPHRD